MPAPRLSLTIADAREVKGVAVELLDVAERVRRCPPPSHRRPHVFHEARDELADEIARLAARLTALPSERPSTVPPLPPARRRLLPPEVLFTRPNGQRVMVQRKRSAFAL